MKNIFYILLLSIASACTLGYSFSEKTPLPPEVKTVSIAYFQNNASLGPSTLGQTFSESLRDLFQSQTRLELVTSDGDLAYEGNITNYTVQPIAIQGNQTASQSRLTISVNVSYVNTNNPKKNKTQGFTRFADFNASSDLTSVEDELITEIFNQLTQDIYNKTLGDW